MSEVSPMADDLKQKADEAWENLKTTQTNWVDKQDIQLTRSAVSASIAAALAESLAPVLERVGKLEHQAASEFEQVTDICNNLVDRIITLEGYNVAPPKPPAPCATCGGARFVCDSPGSWVHME